MDDYGYKDGDKVEKNLGASSDSENGVYHKPEDVFGDEEGHDVRHLPHLLALLLIPLQIKYKTLSWVMVAVLMIAEIVSNGMLSLPYAVASIGLGPGVAVIAFLGIWATYTSWLLIRFKLRHPQVHTMGEMNPSLNVSRYAYSSYQGTPATYCSGGLVVNFYPQAQSSLLYLLLEVSCWLARLPSRFCPTASSAPWYTRAYLPELP